MEQTYRTSLHYTEVPALPPDSVLYQEYTTYRRELPRLLQEGHEGKFILIKGDTIIGLYSTHDEAVDEGRRRYLLKGFVVHPIREYEPVIRILPYPRYA
jgi:hypothetical protein